MRRLSMKSKRRRSETASDDTSVENGDASDTSSTNVYDAIEEETEIENIDTPRRGNTRKRSSHGRNILKSSNDDAAAKTEGNKTTTTEGEEKGNKNASKGGANKRLKKDRRASSSNKSDASEEEYEVEKIMAQRTIKGRRQFLVRWKGYDEHSDTWEQEKDLNCPELIEEFLAEDAENHEGGEPENSVKRAKKYKSKTSNINERPKRSRNSANKQTEDDKEVVASGNVKNDKDNQKEFEVEKIIEVHFKKNKTREFLIRWKGFTAVDDTWEPEENLNCPDLIAKFMAKVEEAKTSPMRQLRAYRPHTKRYTLTTHESGRRLSRRNIDKQRATYHECDSP